MVSVSAVRIWDSKHGIYQADYLVTGFGFYLDMMELDLVVRRSTQPATWRIAFFTQEGQFPLQNLAFKFLKLVYEPPWRGGSCTKRKF